MTVYEQMNATIDHILTDESLTDQLDDQAAKRLLTWGLKLIANIRGDEDEADEDALLDTSDDARIFAGLAAIPELLNSINCWLATETRNAETNRNELDSVLEKMQVIRAYFKNPSPKHQRAFLKQLAGSPINPEEKIKRLIQLF